jgi:hypothetical protein
MAALWKMTSISIESPAMSAEALYAVLAMPSASPRNRNQQTIVSFSVRSQFRAAGSWRWRWQPRDYR